MTGAQIASRALRRFRYRYVYPLAGRILYPEQRDDTFAWDELAQAARVWPASSGGIDGGPDEAVALCGNGFAFLNCPPRQLGNPVAWRSCVGDDPLWNYTLHYGEWAEKLAQAYRMTSDATFRDALLRLISDWIDHYPLGAGGGWDPYPISRRLMAWSKAGLLLSDDIVWSSFWTRQLGPSLHQQTRVLAANLEKDLANNHLIANYRALACMGLLFSSWPGAAKWREMGLQGLWSEMRRQVLPDGVHDERSVSYHALGTRRPLRHVATVRRVRGASPCGGSPDPAADVRFS